MCSILKEIVVCSCNMLFDFFVRYAILACSTMYSRLHAKIVYLTKIAQ